MYNAATIVIPLGFIILAGLLCWFVITAKGDWRLKALLCLTVPAFGLVVWSSLPSYLGWPSADVIPAPAVMLWVDIHEPGMGDEPDGVIYLWLVAVEDDDKPRSLGQNPFSYAAQNGTPRAYRLPYSRKAHEALYGAREMVMAGETVVLGRKGKAGEHASRGMRWLRVGGGESEFEFEDLTIYQLPAPTMMPK